MFAAIDWSRPWYASVRHAAGMLALDGAGAPDAVAGGSAEDLVEGWVDGSVAGFIAGFNAQAAARDLRNHRGLPLSFVPQSALPEGSAYESFIGATGAVPTRDNLHDFFNGLVWLSFPRIKRQLNALQSAQIALAGIGKSRGAARDAATIFDENAALLVVRDNEHGARLVQALRGHQWRAALLEQRASFGTDAQVWLFGHALMEKLVTPYKAITAHTRVVLADDAFFALDHPARQAWLDDSVARDLAAHGLSGGSFTPLPVLGVPGWWQPQDDSFYDDATVFRPKRNAAAV